MTVTVYLPLLASVLIGACAPAVARRLRPATATRLLTAGAVLAAVTSLSSLALLTVAFVGRVPFVASTAHLSSTFLDHHDPVAEAAGWASIAAVLVLAPFGVRSGRGLWRETTRTYRLAVAFADQPASMSVIADPRPQAFAVPSVPPLPGRPAIPSRIITTDSLLRTLGPEQRRAMLAHEQAHLDHRHHLYLLLTGLAAVANPLLGQLPDAVIEATERWADEDAAAAVGDRTVVAAALGRAALSGLRVPRTVPAMAQANVGQRVKALLAPPPPRRRLLTAAVALALLGTAYAALNSAHESDQLFDAARQAWRVTHS